MIVKVTKRSGQWGISNLFREVSKISVFFVETVGKKLAGNFTAAAQLNGFPSIRAKPSAFLSFLCSQDSKIKLLPSKNSEIWSFLRYYLAEDFLSAEILDSYESWTCCIVLKTIGLIAQKGTEKLRLKETNCRRKSRTGRKTNSFWRVLVRISCAPLA